MHPDGDRFIVPRIVRAAQPEAGSVAAVELERYLIATNWFTELMGAFGEGN